MNIYFIYKACCFCVRSAQYNQEILFDLKWQNSTNAGGGCKEDSSLLFKKYFCNIYLMLEMNGGGKWTAFKYTSSLIKHLTMFPLPENTFVLLRGNGGWKGMRKKVGDREKEEKNVKDKVGRESRRIFLKKFACGYIFIIIKSFFN